MSLMPNWFGSKTLGLHTFFGNKIKGSVMSIADLV